MKLVFAVLVLCLFCAPPVFAADAPAPKPDPVALQKQVTDLTAQVHQLQLTLQGVMSQRDQSMTQAANAAVDAAVTARLAQEAAAPKPEPAPKK